MVLDTIKVYDKYGNEVKYLTQWDINVELQIPDFGYEIAPVCHFACRHEKESKTVTSTLSDNTVTVMVPNIYLTDTKAIDMFVFLYDLDKDTGRTLYTVHLPIEAKPKPETYEYSDNTEIIEIAALKVRLEALIAQAEETINVKIDELAQDYDNQVAEIKAEIADDAKRLNDAIIENNYQLNRRITQGIEDMNTEIDGSRTELSGEIQSALQTLINGIQDGTPKGVFSDVSELIGKENGIYLYHNPESEDNGYVYYWDGETLSDKLLYYAGVVINNNTVTYAMLSNELKNQAVEKIIPYILEKVKWADGSQDIDISDDYTITQYTKADIDLTSESFMQLVKDGCMGIYIETDDNKLTAHVIGSTPTEDIAIQLTIRETV